jgi:methyltransferase family protein
MQYTVEIGVYRGRSFVPQAMAHQQTGGVVIGIDPYDSAAAQEADAPAALVDEIANWASRTNFDDIFSKVTSILEQLGLTPHARLIRATSDSALPQVEANIDMLHIDGNHDTRFVSRDLDNYLPLVKPGGFVIMDDIDWRSVAVCLENLEGPCELVEMRETWGVWRKR